MVRAMDSRVLHVSSRFHEVEGATLEWWALAASHAQFELIGTGRPRGTAMLYFSSAEYIECPTTMHNARLRMATAEETELLRRRLPPAEAVEAEAADHLVIECDEGPGWIYAGVMAIDWVDQPDNALTDLLDGPLWDGGPPLSQL